MAFEYTAKVWENSNSVGNARLVLLVIADRANENGECWPSVADLVSRTKACERSVRGSLKELEDMGEISVVKNGGRRGTNLYRITVNDNLVSGAKSAPAKSAGVQNLQGGGAKSAPLGVQNLHPESVIESINESVSSDGDFGATLQNAFDTFITHRSQLKQKPYTPIGLSTLKRKLSFLSPQYALAILEAAVVRNWIGIPARLLPKSQGGNPEEWMKGYEPLPPPRESKPDKKAQHRNAEGFAIV